jgi:hypothetical protein
MANPCRCAADWNDLLTAQRPNASGRGIKSHMLGGVIEGSRHGDAGRSTNQDC